MSKNKQSERVLNLPAGYFGMVLGTIGMGFAWRYASQVWPVSHWIGDGLVILAMVIWGLLTLAFVNRLLRFPHSVLAEIRLIRRLANGRAVAWGASGRGHHAGSVSANRCQ